MGIDLALHHNIVSDLRSEIASLIDLGSTSRAEEEIYSKPVDTISIASSSSMQYEEPWQDPYIEIREAFETEFSTPKQIEQSAPLLSAFSSSEDLQISGTNSFKTEEEQVIKMLDKAIEDSGYGV